MKTAFIGFGSMAYAMAHGMIKYGGFDPACITSSARSKERLKSRAEELGIGWTIDNREAAQGADILFLAVKPYQIQDIIQEIREGVSPEAIVVSVAAGVDLETMTRAFGRSVKLVRALPNTPVQVGEGVTLYRANEHVTAEDEQKIREILTSFGIAERVEEDQFAGPGSMTGCSPAFVYMLMEAMGDAAVLKGMKREAAYRMAAQTVKGAGQMLLETGLHPGILKDMVTSPGGTTIEGVRTLEKLGFRSAMMEAIIAAAEKSGR